MLVQLYISKDMKSKYWLQNKNISEYLVWRKEKSFDFPLNKKKFPWTKKNALNLAVMRQSHVLEMYLGQKYFLAVHTDHSP